jgi:hypothetical protein|tara:strand:- start:7 stop:1509 length:1503 start_codon:yes stop_codon:yes gene_type:complete
MVGLPSTDIEKQSADLSTTFIKEYKPDENVFFQSIKNIPSSGKQLFNDIITPFMHPIQTAKDLKSLGSSVVNLIRPGDQGNEELAKAVGQFFKDRYGGLDNIKKTFATDPVGMLADLSIILTGGGALAAKAPGVAGQTAKIVGSVGKTIDPISQAVKIAAVPTKIIPPVLSKVTGVSSDALKGAYAAGKSSPPIPFVKSAKDTAFTKALRQQDDYSKIVEDANKAFEKMKKKKKEDYITQTEKLKLSTKKIDFSKVQSQIDEFVEGTKYEGFTELSKNSERLLNAALKEIEVFSKNKALHNAKGLDMLKKRINDMFPLNPKSRGEQAVITSIKNIVRDEIIKQVPDYAKVMEAYELASKLEKQLMQELSLGKANASTTLKKLQSVMRNNANTNYGSRLQFLNKLDDIDNINLMERLAGSELSTWKGRGIQGGTVPAITAYGLGSGNLATLGVLPFMSPRLTGEAARLFGKASNVVTPSLQASRAAGLLDRPIQENRGLLQ